MGSMALCLSETRCEALDPELLGCPCPGGPVRLEISQVRQRRRRIEGCDVPEGAELGRLCPETPRLEHRLQVGVLLEQCGCGLRADATRSRDLVGRVAAERNEVADLVR